MTRIPKKRSADEVRRLWRTVLALLTQRAGLDLDYVLTLQPFVDKADRDLLKNQANGCRHLALYLLRTRYMVTLVQLGHVSGLSHQRVKCIIDYVARDRDDNPPYEAWITSYERVLETIGEPDAAGAGLAA